ncbi:MAG: transporter substrate-binding domain-containing protein [Verrucomicrobia bacterium]|nr:transporter substrate-binding domain-containing protein [Verrucomicrobiota bacterium]
MKIQGLLASAFCLAMALAGRASEIPVPPPGASSRIDQIKQRGSLRVAVLDEYPWLEQNTEAGGKPFAGPAWCLAEEYANRLGVRLETIPVTFANKVSIVTSGQVDITIAPLLQTPEREKIVDFITYSMSAQCLFGLATNPKVAEAKSLDDLNRSDVTIAYIIGSPQGAWLEKRLPQAQRRGVPGSVADVAIDEITSHRADVANIDKFFFSGLAEKVPGLISVPKEYLTSQELPIPVGMAISANQPEFLAWLRAVAEAIRPQLTAKEKELEKAGS